MKVQRSTKHDNFMHEIARKINARRAELIAAGIPADAAGKQANDEVVKPELARRAERRRNV